MKSWVFVYLLFMSVSASAADLNDIYKHLDITSFNSSLRPMQTDNERFLPEVSQLPSPIIKNNEIRIEDEYWIYSIKVMRENKLDIHVCFLDVSKDGTYDTQGPMIIRKYGQEYVAISSKTDVCDSYEK
ncbi:hypothetical protein [Vibrio sp.]|uniref:hypothetical protein n=1 Tax=Vibrio sp. TaxID=678 RepID=UPI003AA9C5FC